MKLRKKIFLLGDSIRLVMPVDAEPEDCRQAVDGLCARDNPAALEYKAYACYGGNAVYPCDWPASRDCLLRLLALDTVSDEDKCGFANTLGYIACYGRCDDGRPQYPEAAKYFTMGALGGHYESLYKLADLYLRGLGVEKNTGIAVSLTTQVYTECREALLQGEDATKFADAALRMDGLCESGLLEGGTREALRFYLEADCAIRLRLCAGDFFGDAVVFSAIQRA